MSDINTAYEPSRRTKRVWERFVQWYGTRVIETHGAMPSQAWDMAVNTSSDEQVAAALQAVKVQHAKYPPTFPEFEALLRKAKPADGVEEMSVTIRMTEYILRQHSLGLLELSPNQIRGPWRWVVRWNSGNDKQGAIHKEWEPIYTTMVIEADGDHPERRFSVADIIPSYNQ